MKQGKGKIPCYRVFNPLGDAAAEVGPSVPASRAGATCAPSFDGVDGRTIYLVDVGFGSDHDLNSHKGDGR